VADAAAIFATLESGIPGFIAALIVDRLSGEILVSRVALPGFDLEEASAMSREVVALQTATIGHLDPDAALEVVALVLPETIHLIRLLTPTRLVAVSADRWRANVSLLRTAVARHAPDLASVAGGGPETQAETWEPDALAREGA